MWSSAYVPLSVTKDLMEFMESYFTSDTKVNIFISQIKIVNFLPDIIFNTLNLQCGASVSLITQMHQRV